MFEKVNPAHPDKVADRISGAIVDLCYTKSHDPKIAVEVLIGHQECNIQVETSEQISAEDCEAIVRRIAGDGFETRALIVPQVLSPLWQGGGYKAWVEIKQAA